MSVGGEVTSLDKSVFFWTQKGFEYGYGMCFRDTNTPNIDKAILRGDEDFETCEQSNVIGLISIHVGDLLISGSEMFTEYITRRMKENPKWISMKKTKRPIWGCESLK